MADNTNSPTVEELQKQLAAERAKTKSLQERVETAEDLAANQEMALASAKETGVVSKPVPGKVKVTLEDADGNEVTKTIGFKPGRVNVPLADGTQVPSALLLKVASGKKLTKDEAAAVTPLARMTKDAALDRLTYLASMGATYLREV